MKKLIILLLFLSRLKGQFTDTFSDSTNEVNDPLFGTDPSGPVSLDSVPYMDNPLLNSAVELSPFEAQAQPSILDNVDYSNTNFAGSEPSYLEPSPVFLNPQEFGISQPAVSPEEKANFLLRKIANDNVAPVKDVSKLLRGFINEYNYTVTDRDYYIYNNDEWERAKNIKEVSTNLKAIQDAYTECLDKLSDLNFSEENVEKCLGPNNNYLINDIDYERLKIIARTEQSFRKLMVDECYLKAGEDVVISHSCDLLSTDVVKMMWLELNFYELPNAHQEKYLKIYCKMPEDIFHTVMLKLKTFYEQIKPLMKEINLHKQIVLVKMKTYVNDRKFQLSIEFKDKPRYPIPIITKHSIEIEEILTDPHSPNVIYPGLKYPSRSLIDDDGVNEQRNLLRRNIEAKVNFKFKNTRRRV